MRLCIAVLNMKPGTAKTTSTVWLSAAMAEENPVLAVNADPAESLLDWLDLAGGLPFRVTGLTSRRVNRQVPQLARPEEDVLIDVPQIEDHEATAESAMQLADELLVPVAPSDIELNRTAPVLQRIALANARRAEAGKEPARSCVLLNRCVTGSRSARNAPGILRATGFDVLDTQIPRHETYATSFGTRPSGPALESWRLVAAELRERAGLAVSADAGRLAALRNLAAAR